MVLVRKKRSWLEKSGHFLEKIGLDVKALNKTRLRNILGILVVGTSICVGQAHSTCEEELCTHNPHAVWVGNGCNNVVISTPVANVAV